MSVLKVEYQYSSWRDRESTRGRWWIESDKTFTSKSSRTKFINKMNSKYQFIEFRIKDKEYEEIEEEYGTELVTKSMKKEVIIYTDGSADYRTKLGGLGIYMQYGSNVNLISRGYSNTTNNRMELRAVIESLKCIVDKTFKLTIYSDSQLVVNTFTSWIFKWEEEGWFEKKNVDLLKEGLAEYRKFPLGNITLHWVKGHSGVEGNEIADRLAEEGRSSNNYIECQ